MCGRADYLMVMSHVGVTRATFVRDAMFVSAGLVARSCLFKTPSVYLALICMPIVGVDCGFWLKNVNVDFEIEGRLLFDNFNWV